MGCRLPLTNLWGLSPHVLVPKITPAQLSTGPGSVAGMNLTSPGSILGYRTYSFCPSMTQELPREVCQEVCLCNELRNLNEVLINLRRVS